MKLLIATPYFHPAIGGVEKHAYEIAKRLVKNYQIEVVVVTSNHREKKYYEEEISGIKIYRLSYWFKISNTPINPLWYIQIGKIIKSERPDVVNGRAPVPFMADVCALACGRIPFILGYHFPSMRKGGIAADFVIRVYETVVLKLMLNRSKAIICSSDFVRRSFLKNYSHKTITITQGIDKELFRPEINNTQNKVLFVGNFKTPVKGLSYLLEAIKLVEDEIEKVKLIVVGEGDVRYYRNLCLNLGIEQNVSFRGTLHSEDLVKEYQQTNVLVLSSICENFPSVLLEAQACKKPVIGTNVGGVPDIIEDGKTGVLVPPKNSKALAEAIIRVLTNPKLAQEMGEDGYQKIKDSFDWEEQTRKTKELIESVLNQL